MMGRCGCGILVRVNLKKVPKPKIPLALESNQ